MSSFKSWKSFDFGPPKEKPTKSSKRHKCQEKNKIVPLRTDQLNSGFEFFKEITPKSVEDLVVHNKKLQDVQGWLNYTVQSNSITQKTQFLLITGPTGSGKTSALKILCQSMGVEVAEWTNPVYLQDFDSNQRDSFLEFFCAAKYTSLFAKTKLKVLLVKDFPNAITREPTQFEEILEDISYKSTHPVIFIVTDNANYETNLQRLLFSEETLMKYSINHISFNPCAATLLKKALKRAIDVIKAHEPSKTPSQETVDIIQSASMGDIRCAMNQLFLACVNDQPTRGIKRKKTTLKSVTFKDETLGLFHGIGRVLNPKRVENRLVCDMQQLVDEFSSHPQTFVSYLFENYLKYFGDLHDVCRGSDVLCMSTDLLRGWEHSDLLMVALWIAVSGMMLSNEHRVSKWNQIRAPKRINRKPLDEIGLHPTDRYYYNLINKSEKYHSFKL